MADIVLFTALKEQTAQENIADFINLARNQLTVFGKDLSFEAMIWELKGVIQAKAKTQTSRIYFSNWETVNHTNPEPMPTPFLDFAKAYLRYQQGFRPIIDQHARLAPLQALCFALHEIGRSSVWQLDSLVFNRAAQLLQDKFSPPRAYRLGLQLDFIANFLDEKHLVKTRLGWKNPISRPGDAERVGKEFDARRQEKLPSASDLDALARAYVEAKYPEDILITSIGAVLCSTPDRISEILTLRENCEFEDKLRDGKIVYGLRYWPAKGGDPMIKYVIPSMIDLVKEAIARIRKHTTSARALASWYEKNPEQLYLPTHLESLRNCRLTLAQVSEIVFGSSDFLKETFTWLNHRRIKQSSATSTNPQVAFSDLQRVVLAELPSDFPYLDESIKLKYSEALCVVHHYAFNQQKRIHVCKFESIQHGNVADGLGTRIKHGISSVFSRLGITSPNGDAIEINTHKFRHYLNTLAMHGDLSELDIAKWSGRKDVRQNRSYDHVSARDKLAVVREMMGDKSNTYGVLGKTAHVPAITRNEFGSLQAMTAHTTEFGYCLHDFASTPCQKYLDCLNCNEQICVKGDLVREANIRRQRDETTELLTKARQGLADNDYGADRWVAHQTQTLKRLDELCDIFDNPKIQSGAVIQLRHLPSSSRLSQAASALGMNLSNADADFQNATLFTTIGGAGSLFGSEK